MVHFVVMAAMQPGAFNDASDRNLVSIAFKSALNPLRSAWRHLETLGETKYPKSMGEFRTKVAQERKDLCNQLLQLLETKLVPEATDLEEKVWYLKLQADYYRYLAEVIKGEELAKAVKQAEMTYEQALVVAKDLDTTDPTRLGLSLNYSVFLYEQVKELKKARAHAKDAWDGAIAGIEQVSEEHLRDTTSIMQLLRQNIE